MISRLPSSLLRALAAAFVTFGAAEGVARLLLSHTPLAHSYEVTRNPHFRRGWVDFTSPRPRRPGERLIIVIGNSQGFFSETTDGSLAYPSRLRALLVKADPGHSHLVANWSIPGGAGPEMALLGARAAAHRPDVVVLVTYATNFTGVHAGKPLSFSISDIDQLAYLPEVRQSLSPWFLTHFDARDALAWLSSRSGLMRLRSRFLEQRDEKWTWYPERGLNGANPPVPTSAWTDTAGRLLLEFRQAIARRSPETTVLIVNMPVRPTARLDWVHLSALPEHARNMFWKDRRVTILDAMPVIEPRLFYSDLHMRPAGHEEFARWLLPHLRHALESTPSVQADAATKVWGNHEAHEDHEGSDTTSPPQKADIRR